MKQSNFVIVLTTVETERQAEDLSQKILEKRFAACVQIQQIRSRYWWNDKIAHSDEYLLSIKTRANLFCDANIAKSRRFFVYGFAGSFYISS
jgi:periplasmic divalent cation tolerance protein